MFHLDTRKDDCSDWLHSSKSYLSFHVVICFYSKYKLVWFTSMTSFTLVIITIHQSELWPYTTRLCELIFCTIDETNSLTSTSSDRYKKLFHGNFLFSLEVFARRMLKEGNILNFFLFFLFRVFVYFGFYWGFVFYVLDSKRLRAIWIGL